MNSDENMRRAQHAYDNLTPEDFNTSRVGECDRCNTEQPWDDLRHVDSLDIYECVGCLAHGSGDAVGEEWRRSCGECGEFGGASKITSEGWMLLCWGCRQEKAEGLKQEADKLIHRRQMLLDRRVEGANSDYY